MPPVEPLATLELLEIGALDFLHWFDGKARHALHVVLFVIPGWLIDGGKRLFWVYLLSFVLIGALVHWWNRGKTRPAVRGTLRFLFPREVYTHPSALLDYKLVLANQAFAPTALLSRVLFGSLTISYVAKLTHTALLDLVGSDHVGMAWGPLSLALFVFLIALARDFSTYLVHALHHRSALLWEFHKVHHTAEVLTPITVYRKHPVYNLLSRATNVAIVGPVEGVIALLFAGHPHTMTLFGANVVFSLFHVFGANLRHSHIWLSFGSRVERVLMSPAQHQIHHSKALEHWNKNYGEIFSLWDWAFGTLYVTGHEREALVFGVAGAEDEHSTLRKAYLVPFSNCARILRDHRRRRLQTRYA